MEHIGTYNMEQDRLLTIFYFLERLRTSAFVLKA